MYDPAYDPLEHLDHMNVQVRKYPLQDQAAIWVPERRLVLYNRNLPSEHLRPALAHECSHVEHDDPGGHHPRYEARANLESALRLTDPREWDALTRAHSDYDRICLDLGINRGQFLAYRNHLAQKRTALLRFERLGNTVYLDPKMGAKQWIAKIEVS